MVVAVKTWAGAWSHQRVKVECDNMNAVLAMRSGRSRDPYMQACVRELFMVCVTHDIELQATHCPGSTMYCHVLTQVRPTEIGYWRIPEDTFIIKNVM